MIDKHKVTHLRSETKMIHDTQSSDTEGAKYFEPHVTAVTAKSIVGIVSLPALHIYTLHFLSILLCKTAPVGSDWRASVNSSFQILPKILSRIQDSYLAPSILPSTLSSFPVPAEEKPPATRCCHHHEPGHTIHSVKHGGGSICCSQMFCFAKKNGQKTQCVYVQSW